MKHSLLSLTILMAACGGSSNQAETTCPSSSSNEAAPSAIETPQAVGHPSSELIPRTVFFGNPDKASPTLSPDGKQMAFLAERDGVLNDGKPSAALPMVLLVHGGPWSRDNWGYNSLHQLLANRGYAVLSVNKPRPIKSYAATEAFLSTHLGGWYEPANASEFAGSTMMVPAGVHGIPGFVDLVKSMKAP